MPTSTPLRRRGQQPEPARCDRVSCPNKRSHDTYSAFRHGCRSPAACAAEARYHKEIAAGIHTHAPLPIGPYARRLRALCAIGYDTPTLAQHCEFSSRRLAQIRKGTESATLTRPCAEAVDALFRRLDGVPPPTGESAKRALRYAAKHDWYPADAYDDIDDMTEEPEPPDNPHVNYHNLQPGYPDDERTDQVEAARDRRAEIVLRTAQQQSASTIAAALGITKRSVERHRQRAAAETQEAAAS